MTAFVLITGTLFRAPELNTAKTGKPYVAATIKVVTSGDNAADFWAILAFSDSAQAELLRLAEGDKVSVQGPFKVEPYVARDGQTKINRTVFADHFLALRQPPRALKANDPSPGARYSRSHDDGGPDDPLPF